MRTTLFKEVSYSLSKLIEDIDMGEIGLPDIQRPFVWTSAKVRDLFDSMYKGFPVGYLLFWANGAGDGHRQIGTDTKQKAPRLLIVDGQQRLTSLYAVLNGRPVMTEDYEAQQIQISFRPHDQQFEVADAASRRDPEFIANISDLWRHAASYGFISEFIAKLKQHRELTKDEEGRIASAIDGVYDLRNYPFTALELSPNVSEENVADVFVRINSKGVVLKQSDFILTLMSVFWDEGRAYLEHFCRDARKPAFGKASPFNHFVHPEPDDLLRVAVGFGFGRARLKYVYSILRGKDLETEQFSDALRVKQFQVLKEAQAAVLDLTNWHEFLKTLVSAGFRSSRMITSATAVIYAYVMYLVGKRQFNVDGWDLRNVIARWFFMTAMTGRYTGSPETQMEADLLRLRNVKGANGFVSALDGIINDTLTGDFWNVTLPNDLATSAARSPSLFAYYASLNLLGATALFSKLKVSELLDPAMKAHKSPVETHHLFPRGYLKTLGITDKFQVNQIGNYAWVEWDDNIDISDKAPAAYWPLYAKRHSSEELSQMMHWHALPHDWFKMQYDDFLAARRKLMATVIRDAFEILRSRSAKAANQEEELALATIVSGVPKIDPTRSTRTDKTEQENFPLRYWTELLDFLMANGSSLQYKEPGDRVWFNAKCPLPGYRCGFELVVGDKYVSVYLGTNGEKAELREFYESYKESLQKELGGTVELESTGRRYWICIYQKADPSDTKDWPRQHEWMKNTLERLISAFTKYATSNAEAK